MTDTLDLLIELGTEELPPKALKRLSEALGKGFVAGLEKQDLSHGAVQLYATPRRLAVHITALQTRTPDRVVERRGPAVRAAFDEAGNPTKAALGFARSCGVDIAELEQVETEKGAWLMYRKTELGRPGEEVLPDILAKSLADLPIPKRMRWGDLSAEFVRPVHWLVMLFGDRVIPAEVLSVRSGRETFGHRFHHPDAMYLAEPSAYAPLLETEGYVMPDWEARREAIRAQVIEAGQALGGHALIDDHLLDEVTGLVEWPVALSGRFDQKFLSIPPEVLISSMQDHQKYFPVTDGKGHLLPHFITLANIKSTDPSVVIAGNERVIRPRLEDANFFWNQDRKTPLVARIDDLKAVVFQHRIGSLFDKAERVSRLAKYIAVQIGGNGSLAATAAMLAKTDLLTELVGEFPALQGTMGRYYARHDGQPDEIADAMEEQYLPRFAGDALPTTPTGQALAIADKLDTLMGIFGIGQAPSGDKDPFGLRRAALGVLRIIIEQGLDLDLEQLLRKAHEGYAGVDIEDASAAVFDYITERLRAYYSDAGLRPDEFQAVAAVRPTRPLDFHRRINAVGVFRKLPEAASLAAANKRIGNILRKAKEEIPDRVDAAVMVEATEKKLLKKLQSLTDTIDRLVAAADYEAALRELARLRDDVDQFFDDVMVNAEDLTLRLNRLALVSQVRRLFLRVADISKLQ